ncbi:MAG: ABC transporter substrate-binding protein [Anaerolineae bacterium]|nr:ABC transporter substrate-binding protein [Gloeobacterales cyanobacterium ES-bin-313]
MSNMLWTRRQTIQGLAALAPHLWIQSASAKGRLEKTRLKIGFVPVTDCAPLVIAQEKGFFRQNGLEVELSREASWATVRDGVIQGRLDASHSVLATPLYVTVGAGGAQPTPLVALMSLDLNGSGITFSKQLWQSGVRTGADLAKYLKSGHSLTAASSFPASMVHYMLYYYLAHYGIDPNRDLRVVTVPPPQMVSNMKSGSIDLYSIGEPWNARAVFDGVGFTALASRDFWCGHPEKVLMATAAWAAANPNTHKAVVKSLIQACQYCDQPGNRLEVANLTAGSSYTNANPLYARASMLGTYNYGGFDDQGNTIRNVRAVSDFNVFYKTANTRYLSGDNHGTYLWKSHGMWLLTQMVRWGQLRALPKNAEQILDRVYLTQTYREAAEELGIRSPKVDYKPESGFLDHRTFDAGNPVAYIKNFDIKKV